MNISTSTHVSTALYTAPSELRSIAPKYINTSTIESGSSTSQSSNSDGSKTSPLARQKALQESQAYQQVISELKARDQHVRAHERAHLSAAGGYATSGASYTYQVGPDGRRYAVGGEVGIDTSPVAGDPEATIQKARVVQRAALAPSDPSNQDLKVHAQAVQMEMQASQQLKSQEQTKKDSATGDSSNNGNGLQSSNPSALNQQSVALNNSGGSGLDANSQGVDPARLNFEIRMRIGG